MSVRDERFEALLGVGAPLVVAVFDALPDAIGVVWPAFDATGALVDFEVGYTNPSSERMMGVRLGDEVGARLREVMPGVVTMGLYDRLLRVAESGRAESAEITLDTMWRDAIHVRGVWVHTVLPFGSGLLSVAFDVSEERRRENELRDFATVAAHDLREPLVGVHLMAALLRRRGGLGVEEQKMVRLLDDGVQRATALVDSILEYATAADDGASITEVDCGEVVSEVLATLASQIEQVDGRIEVGELPTLQARRPGLFRVFQNLIANALKFHDGDRPHVTVSARHAEAGWTFSVRDNGIGLPKDSAIFEMFTRGGGDHEGSGIGLATCRRIVEAHGGSIWAEPAPGGGSTFLFTLPG
jgi:signal transduction histidine kinase